MKYTIQSGDTLWALARRHNTTVDALMRANPQIKDRNKIFAGRTLQLPDEASFKDGQASSSLPAPANKEDVPPAPEFKMPQGQPINIRPPMFPDMGVPTAPSAMNQVAQDAADAAQGMQPGNSPGDLIAGLLDPTTALMYANPAVLAAMAKLTPRALSQAGVIASPMMKAHNMSPIAGQALSNVRPITGSQGAAQAMLSGHVPQDVRTTTMFGPTTWRDLIYGPQAAQAAPLVTGMGAEDYLRSLALLQRIGGM